MYNYSLVEPAFENCTLVEQIFEAIDVAGLNVDKMTICSSSLFRVDFFNTSIFLLCSSQDSYETISVSIMATTNDKLLEVVSMDAYDDYFLLSEKLIGHKVDESNINNFVSNDVVDEEDEKVSQSWRTGNFESDSISESIVPDDITECRVVALVYNDVTVAYRFKTNRGSFDMNKATAKRYGLMPDKVTKLTRLLLVNGIYMTKGEKEAGRLIPDISDNSIDCEVLFRSLF